MNEKIGTFSVGEGAERQVFGHGRLWPSLLPGDKRPVLGKTLVRAAFAYDADKVSDDTAIPTLCESITVQDQAEDADINVIVRRFGVTGQLPQVQVPPTIEDFADSVTDFQTAMNMIRQSEDSFMQLDAGVRARFGNDPGAFVNFCSDPSNIDAMISMGLAVKRADHGEAEGPGVPGRAGGAGSGGVPPGGAGGGSSAGGQPARSGEAAAGSVGGGDKPKP